MVNIFLFPLVIFIQRATPPTPPKMDGMPPPPVGDVPLDGNLWILFVIALSMGVYVIHRRYKAAL